VPTKTFDALLDLRTGLAQNPGDAVTGLLAFCARNFSLSKAQLFQDLVAIYSSRGKRGGYFVEFGATNGVDLSNTYVLEKNFGWTGILAEPARCWHAALQSNRSAIIDHRCVWQRTGDTVDFLETREAEYSTILEFGDRDFNREKRKGCGTYSVETVSLNDLLIEHNSPDHIDYLSIDTEGSEYAILDAFDFNRFQVDFISIEHNFVEPNRTSINRLLTANGYVHVLEFLSKWDDWYVRAPSGNDSQGQQAGAA
jgi:FkbM family methyltransferase